MLTPPTPLTPAQLKALLVLVRWIDGKGVAPSCGDLAAELGLASKAAAHRLLEGLEERGWISRMHYKARAITILHRPAELATAPPPAVWRPISEAKPGGNLALGNAAGVYAGGMPEKWARGFIREDGAARDDEGYPLNPTHFFVMPDVPAIPVGE